MPAEDLIRSQLQSEEELTDQFQTVYGRKSLQKKSAQGFDLSFGTVMTKLKLFHVVVPCSTNFRDK